jgi:outer membrane protein insertion porin family
MKNFGLSFIFIVLFVAPLLAQQSNENLISEIKIVGNQRIATETFQYYITSKVGTLYDATTVHEDFKRLWQTGFLNDLKIETEKTPSGIVLIFKVEERPLVKQIEYTGNKKVSKDDIDKKLQDENIGLKIDQPYDPYAAKKISNAIEALMVEKGLRFGTVKVATEALGPTGTKVNFQIDEGPKARIGEIQFEGNKVFSDGKLKGRMKDTKERGMFSWITRKDDFEKEKFDKDMERVQDLYYDNGYINARIDDPQIQLIEGKKNRMRLVIPVDEGDQYRTGDIHFLKNTVLNEKVLLKNMELKKGEVFNRSLLREGLEANQKAYGDQGYIYASLQPVFAPDEKNKIINLNIDVQENGQFFINRIEFTGNNYTRDKVIRRELLVQEGELLRVNKFRESLDRIYRLGFFDDIKPNITPVENVQNKADVTIDVKENKRNEIRLGGGYSEFEGFFGNVTFSTKNLFGTGKIFTINLQGGSRSENYAVEILEPYFLDRRISLGLSVFKYRYDYFNFLRDTTGFSVSFGFPIYEDFKGVVSYGFQTVDIENPTNNQGQPIDNTIFPGIELFQSDRKESRVTPQLVRSTINNPMDPTRGTRLVVGHEIVGGWLGGEVNYYKPSITWTQYIRGFQKKHYFAYNVEFGYGTGFGGLELPFYERYFLGGERSIRGYEIRVVGPIETNPTTGGQFIAGGNKFFVTNVEYVVPLAGPLKVAGFLDYGNAFLRKGIDFTDMRGSTGVEIRFLAPFLSAPFRFIWAYNFNRGELLTLPASFRPEKTTFRFSVGTTF